MRILHLINNMDAGGAQKLVADLAMLQDDLEDTTVEIATLLPETDALFGKWISSHSSIPVHSLHVQKPFSLSAACRLRRLFRDYDLIHAHLFPSGYLATMANVGLSKTLVYTEHSTSNRRRDHKILRPLEKIVYSRYDAVVCISEATRENLLSWIGGSALAARTPVIHNGIDVSRYELAQPSAPEEIFGRKGTPVLMVSRFSPAKDHATVIRAISRLKQSDVFIAFVGDGETLEPMKKLAGELNVAERCVFMGNRNDIPSIISAASIGIQASRWEGFGLTALEMMAGGLPVVASDNEGLRNVVEGGALLFKTGDDRDLAEKVNSLLDDVSLRRQTISACRKRAREFDVSKTVGKYQSLYVELINKGK